MSLPLVVKNLQTAKIVELLDHTIHVGNRSIIRSLDQQSFMNKNAIILIRYQA